uniref:Uncharacterized protein n=1 Tax=viral metagenome TaxID=1070528 RepID=A0A6C0B4N2_9ZZZZ
MYIYIQQKIAPGAAGAPLSAVLEIPAGLVVGVYYDDAATGAKVAIPKPPNAPATWIDGPGLVDTRQTFKIDFNAAILDDNDPNKLAFIAPASTGALLGGKKRRYHGKTKKSRR